MDLVHGAERKMDTARARGRLIKDFRSPSQSFFHGRPHGPTPAFGRSKPKLECAASSPSVAAKLDGHGAFCCDCDGVVSASIYPRWCVRGPERASPSIRYVYMCGEVEPCMYMWDTPSCWDERRRSCDPPPAR